MHLQQCFISQVISAPLARHSKHGTGMDIEPQLLAEPDASSADSLVSSNDPDDMANEQTWPTEEEMRSASHERSDAIPDAKAGTTPKTVRKVPKGTSEYQAAWIVDESDEDDIDGEDEDGLNGEVEMEEMEELPTAEGTEMETDDRRSVMFQDLDEAEEARQ